MSDPWSSQQVKFFEQKASMNEEHISPEVFAAVGETLGPGQWSQPKPAYYFKKLHIQFYENVPVMDQWLERRAPNVL